MKNEIRDQFLEKASPFQPLYGLRLDAAASALGTLTALAYEFPCRSDRCLLVMSLFNDLIPVDRYYLAIIDRGGTLRDALVCNALVFFGFVIAMGLFFTRLMFEIRKRETRVAGDDRALWLLITGISIICIIFSINLIDDERRPVFRGILLTTQAAIVASTCLERALVQLLARLWDKPSERHN